MQIYRAESSNGAEYRSNPSTKTPYNSPSVQLNRFLASVRHLRPIQVTSRLRLLARRRLFHRSSVYRSLYSQADLPEALPRPVPFSSRGKPVFDTAEFETNRVTFLNRAVCVGDPIDWFPPESQLWLYNLHYFDYVLSLADRYRREQEESAFRIFRRFVAQWIQTCPIASPIAWDPYPVSLRISNWIAVFEVFRESIRDDKAFEKVFLESLHTQASYLEQNIEYHLLANHLIENGRALLLAGLFFSGESAARWQRKGELILWNALEEQFVDDGGHFERSPMYHQMMLALYLDVVSTLESRQLRVPDGVKERIRAMQSWLVTTLHPDGNIPLLNDAAMESAGAPTELLGGAPSARDGLSPLPSTGYFIFRDRSAENYLIFDCGPLGPDFQPGHGHCDTLSFELSLGGKRMIVDSGVGDYYGELRWREYDRSTRAHNTVVIDGSEQSDVWSRFRVGRRARPSDVKWSEEGPQLAYVCGSHDGYRHLKGRVQHRRWICWVARKFWVVFDRISGRGMHSAESLIHFHPDVIVRAAPAGSTGNRRAVVERAGATLQILPQGAQEVVEYYGRTDEIQGWYSPKMGVRRENLVWGFCRQDVLPIWLGYILWPSSTRVTTHFSVVDDLACRVNVESIDDSFELILDRNGAKLEGGQWK